MESGQVKGDVLRKGGKVSGVRRDGVRTGMCDEGGEGGTTRNMGGIFRPGNKEGKVITLGKLSEGRYCSVWYAGLVYICPA